MGGKMEEQTAIIDDFSNDDKIVTENNIWDYKNKGNTIIGYVIEIIEEGIYGREIVLEIGVGVKKILPSLTALNTKLKDVEVGDKLKVVCLGEFLSANKKKYYDFDVFVKKNDRFGEDSSLDVESVQN